jgi:hypothetical protein
MTEEEFFSIWANQTQQIHRAPEYRLYHDENGFPLFFSQEDVPGNYIVVDQETFLGGARNIRVIDGKLKIYQIVFGKKLVPADQGQACDPRNVCVVVTEDQPHIKWNLKHQEPNDDQTD